MMIVGQSIYYTSVAKINPVKKEQKSCDKKQDKETQLTNSEATITSNTLVDISIKKYFTIDFIPFSNRSFKSIIAHNTTAITTFFVKLFTHTIATKAP
jgi:hypothetical protein